MASWLINTFNAGISDYENKGARGSFKAGQSLDIRKLIDSLSCQQAIANETITDGGGLTDLPLFMFPASDGQFYAFCRDGKIFRRTSGGVWALMYTDTNESGNIIGAAQWVNKNGWTYLMWATPTRLNVKKLIGPAYSNTEPWADVNVADTGTWPKTNLTSATWHTMVEVNGTLQIANKNVLALVGFDFSYTNLALQLVPHNLAKAIIERGVNAIVGCDRDDNIGKSGMFQWDQISQNYNNKKILPVKSINALIDTDKPLAQVGTKGALFYTDFLNSLPITYFPGGGQCYPDGVENDDGLALFGVFGNGTGNTGIYSFGKKRNNAPYALNLEYPITCDEIGSVKKVGTDLFISYKNGSNYKIAKVNTSAKAQGSYYGLDLEVPAKYIADALPLFTKVRLKTAPLPSGTNIEVWRRIDKNLSNGFTPANMEGGSTQFNTTGAQEAWFYIGDYGKIIEPKLILNPSGNNTPEVYSIEVFFDIEK